MHDCFTKNVWNSKLPINKSNVFIIFKDINQFPGYKFHHKLFFFSSIDCFGACYREFAESDFLKYIYQYIIAHL